MYQNDMFDLKFVTSFPNHLSILYANFLIVLIYHVNMGISTLYSLVCILLFLIIQNVAQRHACMWPSTCLITLLYYAVDIRTSMFQSVVDYAAMWLVYQALSCNTQTDRQKDPARGCSLRHCATSRKVTGSILGVVIGIFH
jgi:hypothetical protein